MILSWLVWLFVAPQLFWVDHLLADTFADGLDFPLAVAFVLALFVRTSALPGLLFCTALGRSLFDDGGIALHFLSLGLPIAALIPLRSVFFRGSILWQAAAAAFLAIAVPRVFAFFAALSGVGGEAVMRSSMWAVAWALVFVPMLGQLLRRLPPLRAFTEPAT